MVAVESRPGFAKTFIMTGWVLSNHYAQFAKLYLHIITYQTFCFRYSCLDSELPDSHTHYNYQSLIQMDHTMIHVWKVHLASLRNFLLTKTISRSINNFILIWKSCGVFQTDQRQNGENDNRMQITTAFRNDAKSHMKV